MNSNIIKFLNLVLVAISLILLISSCSKPLPASKIFQPVDNQIKIYQYAQTHPAPIVILIHDVGVNSKIWNHGKGQGLLGDIYRKGYQIYSIEYNFNNTKNSITANEIVNQIGNSITNIAKLHPNSKIIALGHGFGGSLIYSLKNHHFNLLSAVIGISSPIMIHHPTRAFQALLELSQLNQSKITWWENFANQIPADFKNKKTYKSLLVSSGWPSALDEVFFKQISSPIHNNFLLSMTKQLSNHELVNLLLTRDDFPWLTILSPCDGLVPPYLADPTIFGISPENVERHYMMRANGAQIEYNHFDLLLHPFARDEVFPKIINWIEDLEKDGSI